MALPFRASRGPDRVGRRQWLPPEPILRSAGAKIGATDVVLISVEEARLLLGPAGLTVELLESPTDDVYIVVGRECHPSDLQMTAPAAQDRDE